jgi:hypothetical protein
VVHTQEVQHYPPGEEEAEEMPATMDWLGLGLDDEPDYAAEHTGFAGDKEELGVAS